LLGLGEDEIGVHLAAALDVGLAAGVGALAEELGFGDGEWTEVVHVGGEEFFAGFGAGDAVVTEAGLALEALDAGLGLGAVDAIDGAGVVTEGGQHVLDGANAPAFGGSAGFVELFPAGDVAGENGVDGFGAVAGEEFVEGLVAGGVGVAEDGEGGVGVFFAEGVEVGELLLHGGENEGGAEGEANIVELPTRDGDQLHADGVPALALGGGGDQNGKRFEFGVTGGQSPGLWFVFRHLVFYA
jgi:hypothetical protein